MIYEERENNDSQVRNTNGEAKTVESQEGVTIPVRSEREEEGIAERNQSKRTQDRCSLKGEVEKHS